MSNITKTAMITVCGRPNVGKSSLTNALVGEKVAIVSNKAQTTRNRIYGIVNREDTQYILLDTPGLHKPKSALGDYMVKVVTSSLSDVDCALLLVEPIPHVGGPEKALIDRIREEKIPCILCINKIDTVEPAELLPVIAAYNEVWDGFDAIIPISAHKGGGLDDLMHELQKYAQEGPQLFPDGETTDQPERQVMGELLREKLLLCLDKEIPHGTAVEITKFSERDSGVVDVDATIYCEKASHKGIIIGKQGAMLKKISSLARADMEKSGPEYRPPAALPPPRPGQTASPLRCVPPAPAVSPPFRRPGRRWRTAPWPVPAPRRNAVLFVWFHASPSLLSRPVRHFFKTNR